MRVLLYCLLLLLPCFGFAQTGAVQTTQPKNLWAVLSTAQPKAESEEEATKPTPDAVPHQVLVRFRENVGLAEQQAVLEPLSARVKYMRRPGFKNVQRQNQGAAQHGPTVFDQLALVQLDEQANVAATVKRLQRNPEVLYAEPNFRLRILQTNPPPVIPDDFDFAKLWSLNHTGQVEGKENADIDAPEAWRVTTGDHRVIVAVIDTGIDYFHPDLAENLWANTDEVYGDGVDDDHNGYIDDVYGYDFFSDDSDPFDDHSHGTHVSGILGAVGNNKIGIAGVCWHVRIMALKAFDETGNGDIDMAIEAIHYAIKNGAHIINASWGGAEKSRALQDAITEAHNAGLLFIAAAGNDNTDSPTYPAAYDDVIAVGATDEKDARASFSNFGSFVDVAAPGLNIYSTIPGNYYDFFSGTSMATPHVAGVAALILAQHPDFTNVEVENILRNAVDVLAPDKYIGTGRVNARLALAIDVPLPVAQLKLPEILVGNHHLHGTAKGDHFANCTLAYGIGSYPTNWTEFFFSTNQFSDGVIFENFYTPDLDEGIYTFRLTAKDAFGRTAVDKATVRVSNVQISYPLNNDVRRAGETIIIKGRSFGRGRTFTVEHGVGWKPTVWLTNGVTLVNGGIVEILDDTLATWDTTAVSAKEFYTLKLTARAPEKIVGEYFVHMIYLDSQLKPGWPQYLPIVGEYPVEDWRDIKVADLDHDDQDELILVDHANNDGKPARLLVYSFNGRLLWSKELTTGPPYSDIPVVGDIDNDGFMEIFADAGDKLFAFRHDGTPLPGNWPLHLDATSLGKVLADLDGDGTLELITYSQNAVKKSGRDMRQLRVIDPTGKILQSWDLPHCSAVIDAEKNFPAVGNLNSDPDLEIVAVSGCNELAAYSLKQPDKPLWTAYTDGALLSSPVIGDINHDGKNEIIIGAYKGEHGYYGGLYAFNNSGQPLRGWPVLVDESFSAAPSLADFFGDGRLQISIPSWNSKKLHLVMHNGFEPPGWPVGPLQTSSVKTSTIIGDINNDGRLDVVIVSAGNPLQAVSYGLLGMVGGIKAWSLDGQPIDLNEKEAMVSLVMESTGGAPRQKGAPLTLADIDHDGKLDLIAASLQDRSYSPDGAPYPLKNRSSIYVWSLDFPFARENMPWPTFQGNPQHTGSYQPPSHPNQPPVVSKIPDQTIPAGKNFFPIELDRYVDDPDNKPAQIAWSIEGNRQLKVVTDTNRTVTVLPPDPNWTGEETLRFVARDPGGITSATTAVFAVKAGYNPPVAESDRVPTLEDMPIEINALANDTDPRGNPLSIATFSKARNGTVKATPDGKLLYTPAVDFNGLDTFNYIVSDGQGGVSMGLVTVEVSPVNDPPLAELDRVITQEDASLVIDVLANDVDVDGDKITLVEFTPPENGSVVINADGALLYMPKQDFSGVDNFNYTITDGKFLASTNVTVLVKPVNDLPMATDQSFTLNKNAHQSINFLATDADQDTLTYKVIKSPEHGDLYAYPAVATYYPQKEYVGTDSFTYLANDGQGDSHEATVRLSMLNANNVPVADSQSVVTKVDQPLPITLTAKDEDEDPLTFSIVKQPEHGSLGGGGTNVTYQPTIGFKGDDQFTFKVSDGKSESLETTVAINVTDINTAPEANSFSIEVRVNSFTNLIVLQATDGEGNPLTYRIVRPPAYGQLAGTPPNLNYTPSTNYIGSDRFTFIANDGEFDSNPGTVTLVVAYPNHAPVATNQFVSTPRNQSLPIGLGVTDIDGDALRCPILKGPKNGRIVGRGTNFVYTPKLEFVGTDTFTYKAWDGTTYSNIGRVTITVPPINETPSLTFETIDHLPDGQVRLNLKTPPAVGFHIQASTNLVDWVLLLKKTSDGPSTTIVDTNAPSFPQRFYRAVQF